MLYKGMFSQKRPIRTSPTYRLSSLNPTWDSYQSCEAESQGCYTNLTGFFFVKLLAKLGPTPLTAQKIWIHALKPLEMVVVPTLIKLDLVEKCGRYEGFSKKGRIEKCQKWVTSGGTLCSKMPIFCPNNTQNCVLMLVCLFVCLYVQVPMLL